MLRLKTLSFSGIGRFVEEQTIDFTQFKEVIQIEGRNLNTGGSSGAGKSTVFKALEFLLGLNQISNSVLQSRLTENPLTVTGVFDFDGSPLTITRGKKFSIDLNGEITAGSSKLTEEKLDQVLGMPRDLFRKLLHKRQKESGFFLDFTASETHKFLTSAKGLDLERAKLDIIDKKIQGLNTLVTSLESQLNSSQTGLVAISGALEALLAPTCSTTQEAIDRLSAEVAVFKQMHDEIAQKHAVELAKLESARPRISMLPFDRSEIVQLENSISALSESITKAQNAEKERQRNVQLAIYELKVESQKADALLRQGAKAKAEAAAIAGQIEKIKSSICPTCEQSWATEQAKAAEAELLKKIMLFKADMIAAQKAQVILDENADKLTTLLLESAPKPVNAAHLQSEQENANKDLKTLRDKEREHQSQEAQKSQRLVEEFAKRQMEVRVSNELEIKAARDSLQSSTNSLNTVKQELASFNAATERHQKAHAQLTSQLAFYQAKMNDASVSLADQKELLEIAEDAKKAVKSFLSCSFDDALESIGEAATKFIRAIPNMATATIQFEGLKENKDGKVKEEVTALINMDGEIGVPIKSLSGGERSSTDLAIDLAVIHFIEENTGKGINIMILDEPFDGLDFECSSNALEMLKNSNIGKSIVIVDHNPVLKEQIDQRITVVREGTTSTIVQ